MATTTTKPTRETFLTCAVIDKTQDGNYQWYQNEWLLIHETLRREFIRAELALNHMDVIKHPWHITNFHTWLSEYFFPGLHVHHDAEENVVGPHYAALGDSMEFGKSHNHAELIGLMVTLEAQSKQLYDAVHATNANENVPAIQAMEKEFKKDMAQFKEFMFDHFKDEDTFLPAIYSKHGQKEADRVVQKVVANDLSKKGQEAIAFKGLVGSIFDAGGYRVENYVKPLDCGLHMAPWCSEEFIEKFRADLPFIPRVLIFPGWIKEYKIKWKLMIDSVAGDVDVMQLDAKKAKKNRFLCF